MCVLQHSAAIRAVWLRGGGKRVDRPLRHIQKIIRMPVPSLTT